MVDYGELICGARQEGTYQAISRLFHLWFTFLGRALPIAVLSASCSEAGPSMPANATHVSSTSNPCGAGGGVYCRWRGAAIGARARGQGFRAAARLLVVQPYGYAFDGLRVVAILGPFAGLSRPG